MERPLRLAALLVLAALALPVSASAKDPEKTKPAPDAKSAAQEPVCGRDLMTPEELAEHRAKMWSAKTPAEREAYRAEHHAQMMKRAQERGVTLNPAGCPGGGMGMGPGRGMGGPGRHRGPGGGGPPSAPAPSSPPAAPPSGSPAPSQP